MIKLNSGNIELLKLIAAFLMTIDHINKYLFNSTIVLFFEFGRLSMPIFMFILAYNLAHKATFSRVINRLLICGIRGLTLSGTKTHVKQRFLPLTPLLMVSDVLWSPVLPA